MTGLPEIDRFTLRAAQRGDRAAFDAIVDLYADRLRVLAFHLLHDADLVDDALQDVFLKAFRGLSAFRAKSSLGTWLYRVTYTTCIDYVRRREPPSVNYEDAEEVLSGKDDPTDECLEHDRIATALATLSPEQRAAVVLVDLYGYDYGAAGRVLDVPKGTVCSRLNVARAHLRAVLTGAPATAAEAHDDARAAVRAAAGEGG